MAAQATTNFFQKGHNEAAWGMAMVYRGAGKICRKICITLRKKIVIIRVL
jgi:hypothetical protein